MDINLIMIFMVLVIQILIDIEISMIRDRLNKIEKLHCLEARLTALTKTLWVSSTAEMQTSELDQLIAGREHAYMIELSKREPKG